MKVIIKKVDGEVETIVTISPNLSILKQLEKQGVVMQSACHAGICGACICNIEKGRELINTAFITEPGFPLADDEVMTCIGSVTKSEGEIILQKIY